MCYTSDIIKIVKSEGFKAALESINSNYSNLKQELMIKNTILEMYNAHFKSENTRAFSEHPRDKCRIDLSIVNKQNKENLFLVEFKFQFPRDYEKYDLNLTIDYNFGKREANGHCIDLFVLIFAQWDIDEKKRFDVDWGINSDLSRYQFDDKNYKLWKDKIRKKFNEYSKTYETNLREHTITIKQPYEVEYTFFFYERVSK